MALVNGTNYDHIDLHAASDLGHRVVADRYIGVIVAVNGGCRNIMDIVAGDLDLVVEDAFDLHMRSDRTGIIIDLATADCDIGAGRIIIRRAGRNDAVTVADIKLDGFLFGIHIGCLEAEQFTVLDRAFLNSAHFDQMGSEIVTQRDIRDLQIGRMNKEEQRAAAGLVILDVLGIPGSACDRDIGRIRISALAPAF